MDKETERQIWVKLFSSCSSLNEDDTCDEECPLGGSFICCFFCKDKEKCELRCDRSTIKVEVPFGNILGEKKGEV